MQNLAAAPLGDALCGIIPTEKLSKRHLRVEQTRKQERTDRTGEQSRYGEQKRRSRRPGDKELVKRRRKADDRGDRRAKLGKLQKNPRRIRQKSPT